MSQCCSIAGAKGKVGSICGCAQVGKAAALRNQTAGKQAIEIAVTTHSGELLVQGTSCCPGKSWQTVFEILLTQIINDIPVFSDRLGNGSTSYSIVQCRALFESCGCRPFPEVSLRALWVIAGTRYLVATCSGPFSPTISSSTIIVSFKKSCCEEMVICHGVCTTELT